MKRVIGHPLRWICVALILFVGAALAAYWTNQRAFREEQEAAALESLRHRAEALAAAVAEQSRGLIFSVDLALLQLASNYRYHGYLNERDLALLQAALPADMLQTMVVTGADGFVKLASQPLEGPIFQGDAAAFRFHAQETSPALLIGAITREPLDGRWVLPLSRGLVDRQGKFAGVVAIAIRPAYLARLFASIPIEPDDVIALVHRDGALVARTPDSERYLGQQVPADRPYLRPEMPDSGWFRARGPFNDVERIHAYRRTAQDNLIAVVGFSVDAALNPLRAAARQEREGSALISAVALALLGVICVVLWRLERNLLHLQSSDTQLALALAEARELIWHWRADSGHAVIQGSLEPLLGIGSERLEISAYGWSAYLHPDDRPAAALAWNAHIEGSTAEYQCEYRVRSASGDYRWVLSRGRATERDSLGHARAIAGILIDIDPDKQARLTIARLNARYQRLIDAAGQGILVVDRQGDLELMNPAAERLLGWTQALACGQRAHELFHQGPDAMAGLHPWYECPLYMSLQDGVPRRDGRATPGEAGDCGGVRGPRAVLLV